MSRNIYAAILAAQRRSERQSAQRYKAMVAQQNQQTRLNEQARAEFEVKLQEAYLETIMSLHCDAGPFWHWPQVAVSPPPEPTAEREAAAMAMLQAHHAMPPYSLGAREAQAAHALQSYQPGLSERILGRATAHRAALEAAVLEARAADEHELREARAHWDARRSALEGAVLAARSADQGDYQERHAQWDWLRQIAQGVMQRDLRFYSTVLEHLAPFDELERLGANVTVQLGEPWYLQAFVSVRNAEIIPRTELKLLASGRLSTKEMQKAKYWGYYQDHVCSAAIRVARELFHLLPVQKVYVGVGALMLDTATGADTVQTIVSVEFEREKLLGLNFERIDASDAVEGFNHRMAFKKSTGFSVVPLISPVASLTSM